jgi:hypothetical protein
MRPVVSILLGPKDCGSPSALWSISLRRGMNLRHLQATSSRDTLACDSVSRDSPHIFDGLSAGRGGWSWLLRVVVASSAGVLVASFIAANGVDYHDSRNSGLLGAPRIQSLNRALAPGAADDSCCRSRLEKEPGKDEITVPGVSFYGGRKICDCKT